MLIRMIPTRPTNARIMAHNLVAETALLSLEPMLVS